MPFSHYRLNIKGSFSRKGFGFSCMQHAYRNGVTGSIFYESAESVIIEFTGEEMNILKIIEECKKSDYITEIHILLKTKTENKFSDFIMLNQIE